MLNKHVKEWKEATEKIKDSFNELTDEERLAYKELSEYWKNNAFNKVKCEDLIVQLKSGANKHANNRTLLLYLKDFASLCTTYYTKNEADFAEFKKAIDKGHTQSGGTSATSGTVNIIKLKQDVAKWNEITKLIKKHYTELTTEEQSSFDILIDYWRGSFDRDECNELIAELKSGINKHANNRDLLQHIKDFASLCTVYYSKTETEFLDFKKAMGGRVSAPINVAPTSAAATAPVHSRSSNTPSSELLTSNNTRLNFDDGNYYIGEVKNGMPHGQGEYHWADGDWHKGMFVNGARTGQGTYYNVQNKRTDTGQYRDGVRVGRGKMQWSNGEWYEGEWNDSGFNGQGEFHWDNGDWYKGAFVNNLRTGQGTYYSAKYQRTDTGQYNEGVRINRGRMKWSDGNWYDGEWNDYGSHGQGELHWANGDWYKGEFVNNLRTGQGTCYNVQNNRTDTGQYQDGFRKGKGVMKWGNGDRYEGTWDDSSGTLCGQGVYYYSNGNKAKGKWVNGNFEESTSNALSIAIALPWIIVIIAVVVEWIQEGFWMALLTAVVGSIVAYILMFVIGIAWGILSSIFKWFGRLSRWLKIILTVTLITVIFGNTAVSFLIYIFSNIMEQPENVQTVPDITGVWKGTFEGRGEAVLEIISVSKTNEIDAVIKLKSITEQLRGILIIPAAGSENEQLRIQLEEINPDNKILDGKYEAIFNAKNNIIEGTYTPVKASSKNKAAKFSLTKTTNTGQSSATSKKTEKKKIDYDDGSSYTGELVNSVPHEKGKRIWNNDNCREGKWKNGKMHGQGTQYYAEYKRTDVGKRNICETEIVI
jgi:predicted nucleic-acid-binding protein